MGFKEAHLLLDWAIHTICNIWSIQSETYHYGPLAHHHRNPKIALGAGQCRWWQFQCPCFPETRHVHKAVQNCPLVERPMWDHTFGICELSTSKKNASKADKTGTWLLRRHQDHLISKEDRSHKSRHCHL